MRLLPALLLVVLVLAACGDGESAPEPRLRLATTTSTRDSGLLDHLLPAFEKEAGCKVDVIAVGTGAALELGRNGDADVVLVHARGSEEAFMAEGHAQRHEEFMLNYFMILGPPDDPAGIRNCAPDEAIRLMAATGSAFVSRGDDSGTHKKEKALRAAAGLGEGWAALIESGQGMGATLIMADEKGAYVLSDSATFIKFRSKLRLVPLIASHDLLRNPYAVMPVDDGKHPGVKAELADRIADFLISAPAQQLIRDYRVEGQALFTPTRLADDGR